jgi:hypothetical protein
MKHLTKLLNVLSFGLAAQAFTFTLYAFPASVPDTGGTLQLLAMPLVAFAVLRIWIAKRSAARS